MTDQENTPDALAGLVHLWIVQLHRIIEGLTGMIGLGESALSRTVPALWDLPLPCALSAAQLDSITLRRGRAAEQHRGAAGPAGRVR